MKKPVALVAVALALGASAPALAQKECTKAEAAAAEKAVDRVVNYPGLLKAWRDYGHCSQGPVAELFTEAILRLMVEWKDVDTVAQDVGREPNYKKFVFGHLGNAAKEDRQSIYSRAKASCPLTQGAFCAELVEVVKNQAQPKADDLLAPLPTIPAPKK